MIYLLRSLFKHINVDTYTQTHISKLLKTSGQSFIIYSPISVSKKLIFHFDNLNVSSKNFYIYGQNTLFIYLPTVLNLLEINLPGLSDWRVQMRRKKVSTDFILLAIFVTFPRYYCRIRPGYFSVFTPLVGTSIVRSLCISLQYIR